MIRNCFFSGLISIILVQPNLSYAQDLIKAGGSSQMVMDDTMSKDDLKEELRKMAKIDAIENQFGSLIEQESQIEINEGGSYFNIVGNRYLKGEWIRTTHEKFSEEYRKVKGNRKNGKYELWMSCEITGIIREIIKPEVNYEFTTTNCPEKICRTTDFISGEPLYLFFQTPVDGYLSVYTVEESDAFRILPYQQMTVDYSQCVPVRADVDYVFFSTDPEHHFFDDFSPEYADELIMVTESDKEYLDLYIIFSTDEFVKPTLDHSYANASDQNIVPRSLKVSEFESWLSENRIRSENFYYKKLRLKIVK